MQLTTFFIIFFSILISLVVTYLQYFYRNKKLSNQHLPALFRFISVFLFVILLFNPSIKIKRTLIEKPVLNILVDNSESIKNSGKDNEISDLINAIKLNSNIKNKFDVSLYSFGNSLKSNSIFNFDESNTDIYSAVKEINTLSKYRISPIILISDGNQTFGKAYKFLSSKQKIYPIIIGDTTKSRDIFIERVNVNKFTFLENSFPVEVFIGYKGQKVIRTKLNIIYNNKIVNSQIVKLNENNHLKVEFSIPSNKIGKNHFKLELVPFDGEKNTINNYKNFTIEVINEQSKIALVYSTLHPDIGMFKRSIESNKSKKVDIINIENSKIKLSDYNFFVLYQPNKLFKSLVLNILDKNINYLVVTGKNTDWFFLNKIQSNFKRQIVNSFEDYYPIFNTHFSLFDIKKIDFNNMPPLTDYYGEIILNYNFENILTQSINGVELKYPLLTVFNNQLNRSAVIFGENMWRWRTQSYLQNQSFNTFDQFVNAIIQFLTLVPKTSEIELEYKTFYYANESIKIDAKLYDSNLNFDKNAQLILQFDNDEEQFPFERKGINYQLNIPGLKVGDHPFTVKNLNSNIFEKGFISVGEYSVEQEFTHANISDLKELANRSKAVAFFPYQINELFSVLENDIDFTPIQKERIELTSLINWKWLLVLIVVSLSLEWFIRKYRGLV